MINYTWKINSLNCNSEKVVKSINWNYIGQKNELSFIVNGETIVGEPNPDNFTNFEKLSFEQVKGWIENIYSQEIEGQEFTQLQTLQTNISEQIALLEQPKTITLNPPF